MNVLLSAYACEPDKHDAGSERHASLVRSDLVVFDRPRVCEIPERIMDALLGLLRITIELLGPQDHGLAAATNFGATG